LRRAYPDFQAAGLAVAVVGMGTPEQTAAFVREVRAPFPILADPDRAAYRAYGLVEAGAGQILSLATGKAVVGALVRGNRGGSPVGDVRQLGGAFVVGRDGTVRWAKPSAFVGDHASPEELIAAAREA
jgi:alkyl hydroperoxide reductase subunit AhpC